MPLSLNICKKELILLGIEVKLTTLSHILCRTKMSESPVPCCSTPSITWLKECTTYSEQVDYFS